MNEMPMLEHPWTSAAERFELRVLPLVKQFAPAIRQDADGGDSKALKVIRAYQFLRLSFDPMALILLEDSLTLWCKGRNTSSGPVPG